MRNQIDVVILCLKNTETQSSIPCKPTVTPCSILSLTGDAGHAPAPQPVASVIGMGRPRHCWGGGMGETKEELQMGIVSRKMGEEGGSCPR